MSEPASLRLYGHQRSGNCYTAALMLALTETEHEFIRVDLPAGESIASASCRRWSTAAKRSPSRPSSCAISRG